MQFRLTAAGLDFWVDVRLRSWGGRWLAVAELGGDPEIGLGRTARQALEGALASLGRHATRAFLTDTALIALSLRSRGGHRHPSTEHREVSGR